MNILFVSNEFPTPVDPGRAVFNGHMMRGLAERHRVRVVCPVPWIEAITRRGRRSQPAPLFPFPVHYVPFYYPPRIALHRRGAWMWWSLRRLLNHETRRERPDVVFSYWAHPDGEVALRLARRLGIPVVLMVGGSDVLQITRDVKRRKRVEAVLRGVDHVLTIGDSLASQVIAGGVPASRVTAVFRPVAAGFAPGDRKAAREHLGLPVEGAVLLWVGRFVAVKGVETLLEATAYLKAEGRRVTLCLVGSGQLEQPLRTLCTRLRIDDVVRWVGSVAHEQLADWYRAADLTVLPSYSEGVPNVLLESIACGTPFVASRVGSIPDIADERRDSLVSPGDPHDLARALSHRLDAAANVQANHKVRAAGEFQRALDAVFSTCITGPTAAPGMGLRSATTLHPSRGRQLIRRLLLRAVSRRLLLAYGPDGCGAVCLTFDDGPDASTTPQILDTLKREGARATFFVRGDRASERPDLVRRIVAEGHLLGHHSWTHSAPNETSAERLIAEVEQTRRWFREQVGRDSVWFRPPYGKLSVLKTIRLWAAGQTIALWNVDPGDVFRASASEITDWFRNNPPRSGDVVLLHDTSAATMEAMPQLIDAIRESGLWLTTLDRLNSGQAS